MKFQITLEVEVPMSNLALNTKSADELADGIRDGCYDTMATTVKCCNFKLEKMEVKPL